MEAIIANLDEFDSIRGVNEEGEKTGELIFLDGKKRNILKAGNTQAIPLSYKIVSNSESMNLILAKMFFEIRMAFSALSEKHKEPILLFNMANITFRERENFYVVTINMFGVPVSEDLVKKHTGCDEFVWYKFSEIESCIMRAFLELLDPSKNGTYRFDHIKPPDRSDDDSVQRQSLPEHKFRQ